MIPSEILTDTTIEFSITPEERLTSDGYSYVFKLGGGAVITKNGTANGSEVDFKIVPADTAAISTGIYFYQIFAEKSGDRYLHSSGQLAVNQIIGTAPFDGRTVAEKIVAAIDALIQNRATTDQQSYTIQSGAGSRSLSRIPVVELMELRKVYAAIVNRERREKNGGSLFKSHYAQFVNP